MGILPPVSAPDVMPSVNDPQVFPPSHRCGVHMSGCSKNGPSESVSPNPSRAWTDPEQKSRVRCWGVAGLREQKGEERAGPEPLDSPLIRGGACQGGPVWIMQTHSYFLPEAMDRLGTLCSKGLQIPRLRDLSRRQLRGARRETSRAQPESPLPVCSSEGRGEFPNPCSSQFPHLENGESVIQTTFAVRMTGAAYQRLDAGKGRIREQSK